MFLFKFNCFKVIYFQLKIKSIVKGKTEQKIALNFIDFVVHLIFFFFADFQKQFIHKRLADWLYRIHLNIKKTVLNINNLRKTLAKKL